MKRWVTIVTVKLLVLSAALSARGEFVVTIGNQMVPVGGTAYVDVMISSNAPDGDLLNAFNLDFRLSSQGQTRLEFMPTQPDLQLTDSNYVFYGNSLDNDDPLNLYPMPVGTVSSFPEPNSRFVGGDATADFSDLLVTAAPRLLARLQVNASTGLSPNAGDEFALSLDATGSSFQYGDIANPTLVPFASTPGTITISSVPEPSVVASLISGILAVFGYLFFHTRRNVVRPGSNYC